MVRVVLPERILSKLRSQFDDAVRRRSQSDYDGASRAEVTAGCQVSIGKIDREFSAYLIDGCELLALAGHGCSWPAMASPCRP